MLGLETTQTVLVLAGAVLGGAVFGMIGFAFGVIASLFWHHAFEGVDVVFLVVGGALVLNLGMLPRFAAEIDWRRATPYLIGATAGLPFGLWALYTLDVAIIRVFVGLLLASYCLFALVTYRFNPAGIARHAPRSADYLIGVIGGMVGGVCGLGPLVPGIWYGLRGLGKSEQRALSQPVGLYLQGVMLAWFIWHGSPGSSAVAAFALAVPVMLATSCLGLYLFDRIAVGTFQRAVATMAMLGGAFLAVRSWP